MSYRAVGQLEQIVSTVVSPLAEGAAEGVIKGGASVLQNMMTPKPPPPPPKTDYTPLIVVGGSLAALGLVWAVFFRK